ncbi:MAG: nitroreductase family protein [Bacteroidetes bacterium]|nr:nitroreductase family protein [Bacteroidota bacterium]MDA0903974.1 nitroreductase family protein [Bacteroidota bacterium]MDA1243154.1 nitroreductase family protein [Bacteroidota bacterium]
MVKVKMFESLRGERESALVMPPMDAEAFHAVVDSRRSVRIFAEDPVPEDVILRCIEAAQKAPNSSNLQAWQVIRASTPAMREELAKACLGQPAATTAPELFVFVARPDLWRRNNRWTLEEFDRRGDMPERAYQYFTKITRIAYTQGVFAPLKALWFAIRGLKHATPREPVGWSDMRVWAHKSTALSAAHFMLCMRAHGFDTCPMEGMDSRRIKGLLNLPRKAEICMVVSSGRRTAKGVYGDRFRFPLSTFYQEV